MAAKPVPKPTPEQAGQRALFEDSSWWKMNFAGDEESKSAGGKGLPANHPVVTAARNEAVARFYAERPELADRPRLREERWEHFKKTKKYYLLEWEE